MSEEERNRAEGKELLDGENYIAFGAKGLETHLISDCNEAHYILLLNHIFKENPKLLKAAAGDWDASVNQAITILKEEANKQYLII